MNYVYAAVAVLAIALFACNSSSPGVGGTTSETETESGTSSTGGATTTTTGAPLGGPCAVAEDCAPDPTAENICGVMTCTGGTCQVAYTAPNGSACGMTAIETDAGLSKCSGTCASGSCVLGVFTCNSDGTNCGCSK
jgi:hypothetical protein